MEFTEALKNKDSKFIFNPNEFIKESFSVDRFLSNNKCYELEVVRQDLGLLLKTLKKSMIKLINADYEDFIHLSTNLKHLKESLKSLEAPFISLKAKVDGMNSIMENHVIFIDKLITERHMLKILRRNMFSMQQLQIYIEYFKSVGEIEKFCRQIHFVYYSKFNDICDDNNHTDADKLIKYIDDALQEKFYYILKNNNQQQDIYKILLTCSIINCNDSIENTFRNKITKNFVEKEIATLVENKISKLSLLNFYKNLLDFIPLHMKDLLFLTIYNKKVEGPNFLINAFWIEIEEQMRNNLPLIFSPGNPELFISRLESTEMFLTKFEKMFGSKRNVQVFRSNQYTRKFLQRWNLTVYFQIRFQEILYNLEIISQIIPDKKVESQNNKFGINFFDRADKAIITCWSNGIYNSKLFAKFLKLSLQIISRINMWVRNILNLKNKPVNIFEIDLFVLIYVDIELFLKRILYYTQLSQSKIPKQIQSNATLIANCFVHSSNLFIDLKTVIEQNVVKSLTKHSVEHLKFVADLSRMYRKTNREVPIERSNYVHNMTEPFVSFRNKYSTVFKQSTLEKMLIKCFTEITKNYFNCVNDILLSIKRTEESLKRLKSVRAKTMSHTISTSEQTFIGDDDKIRIQLRIDVSYWIKEVEKHLDKSKIINLHDLKILVDKN